MNNSKHQKQNDYLEWKQAKEEIGENSDLTFDEWCCMEKELAELE